MQLEVVPVPTWASVQVAPGLLNEPAPSEANVTVPCGHDFVGASVSETTTVQVEAWLIATEPGEQPVTLVDVDRLDRKSVV